MQSFGVKHTIDVVLVGPNPTSCLTLSNMPGASSSVVEVVAYGATGAGPASGPKIGLSLSLTPP